MRLKALSIGALALTTPTSAFFRLPCQAPVVVQRADPIVNPGALAGHVHTIMGGNGFGFEMDYKSTQKSTCSTCIVTQDMSNYWVPTLYYKAKNGTYISVGQNGGMTVYYLQRSHSRDPAYNEGVHAFPEGFTMLAGSSGLRSYSDTPEQRAISYVCLGTDYPEGKEFPKVKCRDGVRSQVFFPSCWDGVMFQPKDQKKHLAYPSGVDTGYCSPPFNKRLVSIFYEVIWNTPDFDDLWYGNTQPFVWSNGDPTGYGYHGDFVNGWNVPVLQKAINTCTSDSGNIEECKVLNLIDTPTAEACRIPSSVPEKILGVLPALPACNTVQYGPANASPPKPGCGAPTSIGKPKMPYTDVTKTKGVKYIGCGPDYAGQVRSLQGEDYTDPTGMTVERCIDYCRGKGFSVAGVEFSKQCFCDNKVPNARLPDPKRMGACSMPCTGDENQVCGGPALLSLYMKCGAGECKNVDPPFINGSFTGKASFTAVKGPSLSAPVPVKLTAGGLMKKPDRREEYINKLRKRFGRIR